MRAMPLGAGGFRFGEQQTWRSQVRQRGFKDDLAKRDSKLGTQPSNRGLVSQNLGF